MEKAKRRLGGRIALQCERCGHQFTRPASRVKDHAFCSRQCYFESEIPVANARKANRTRFPDGGVTRITCERCARTFMRARSLATGKRQFCSVQCRQAFALANRVRKTNAAGYIVLWVGKGAPGADSAGNILEHRLVMQEHLNRALLSHENVHHINGVRADNRPENLELWSTSQPCGQRVTEKLAWARKFLAQYEGARIG